MAQLDAHHPGCNNVFEWKPRGRSPCFPPKCPGRPQGTERVRHLLFGDFNGHADAQQAVRDVQECVPFGVFVPVV